MEFLLQMFAELLSNSNEVEHLDECVTENEMLQETEESESFFSLMHFH